MAKTTAEKIANKDERIQQLLNEKKQLIQKQKADERRTRTSRLCRRHGLLEKYLPDLVSITDEQFEAFVKKTISNNYGRDALAEIIGKVGKTAASQTAEMAAQSNPTHAAKSAQAVQGNATNGNPNPPKAEHSRA